jgi:hypothetical protein
MVFWGFNPLPYTAWKHAVDDEAAGAAIAKHFPETGTYYFPGMYLPRQKSALAYMNGGPWALSTSRRTRAAR